MTPPPVIDGAALAFASTRRDYEQWNPTAGDLGLNRQKRIDAEKKLTAYYVVNRTTVESAKYVVEAAYAIAKMKQAVGDTGYRAWFKSTVAAWDSYKASAPQANGVSDAQQSPYVDHAAEADFTLLDERISADYDAPARHGYGPTVEDIFGELATGPITKAPLRSADGRLVFKRKGKYALNAAETEKWDLQLDAFVKKYQSREWVPVAIERQGRLYDALRSGLAGVVITGSPRNRDFFRKKREQELDGANAVMVRRYATAVAAGLAFKIKNERLEHALARLGYYTAVLGDDAMDRFVASTPDPATRGATRLTYRNQQYVQPP